MKEYTLEGVNGNAFCVMSYVDSAMRAEGKTEKEIGIYRRDAMSGDYDNLLFVSMDILEELNKC